MSSNIPVVWDISVLDQSSDPKALLLSGKVHQHLTLVKAFNLLPGFAVIGSNPEDVTAFIKAPVEERVERILEVYTKYRSANNLPPINGATPPPVVRQPKVEETPAPTSTPDSTPTAEKEKKEPVKRQPRASKAEGKTETSPASSPAPESSLPSDIVTHIQALKVNAEIAQVSLENKLAILTKTVEQLAAQNSSLEKMVAFQTGLLLYLGNGLLGLPYESLVDSSVKEGSEALSLVLKLVGKPEGK